MTAASDLEALEVRRATVGDAERIVAFWVESGASMLAIDGIDAIGAVVRHPTAVQLVATLNGALIGTLLGTFDGWMVTCTAWSSIHARGAEGIGRTLVRQMEGAMKGWGAKRVIALVGTDRPWAMQFWRAVGYPRDDHDLVYVGALDQPLRQEIDYHGSPIETQPHTGLRCPECKRPMAVLDEVTSDAVTMHCPACGHPWSLVRPGK